MIPLITQTAIAKRLKLLESVLNNKFSTELRSRRLRGRAYSSTNGSPQRSPHAQWYAETLPAMIPVALLGSAIYLGLHLLQVQLANEKRLDEANARIRYMKEELDLLLAEREKRMQQDSSKSLPQTIDMKSRWWFTQI